MNKHRFPEEPSEQTETNNNPERSQVLDAGGKPECPEKNLRKQVWTRNQMDIQRRDRESNPGLVVHIAKEVPLRYLIPKEKQYCAVQ